MLINKNKTIIVFTVFCFSGLTKTYTQTSATSVFTGKRILVFTKNGTGYVHENIPYSIAAFQQMGADEKFSVDTTTDSSFFSDSVLKKYDAIVFSNTNNNVFETGNQKTALMRYVQAGGKIAGIHSAIGTERNWEWFKLMMGASFAWHPPFQLLNIHVLDKTHAAVIKLNNTWQTNDECYFFKEINPSIHVLLYTDISKVKIADNSKNPLPDIFGNRYPASWSHKFDGGSIWYTALGHNKEDYSNPVYLLHIKEGIRWLLGQGKIDYSKASTEKPGD
jgi:type 1 glutamine amidotransferase